MLKYLYNILLKGWIEATSFRTTGGTSSDFVKGDGSLDGTEYADVELLDDKYDKTGGTIDGDIEVTGRILTGDDFLSWTKYGFGLDGDGEAFYIKNNGSTTSTNALFRIDAAGLHAFRIQRNGFIGVGKIPSTKFDVDGTIMGKAIVKDDSSDSHILLGGGGTKAISDFALDINKEDITLNEFNKSGFFRPAVNDSDLPEGLHSHILHQQHPTSGSMAWQMGVPYVSSEGYYVRRKHNVNGWGNWNKLYHSGNFNPSDYSLDGHTHSQYLTSSALNGYATQSWVNSQGFSTTDTDTTYSAGTGLNLSGTQFSIDSTTSSNIDKGVTAHGYGNHAEAGYLTSHQSLSHLEAKEDANSVMHKKLVHINQEGLGDYTPLDNDYTIIDHAVGTEPHNLNLGAIEKLLRGRMFRIVCGAKFLYPDVEIINMTGINKGGSVPFDAGTTVIQWDGYDWYIVG